MIEFTALAVVCGLTGSVCLNDGASKAREEQIAAGVIAGILGILLEVSAALFFVLALITAPWESL